MANELAAMPGVIIDPKTVETNIMYFTFTQELLDRIKLDYRGFAAKMKED